MSSHQGSGDDTPVVSVQQLAEHHAGGERPRERWMVGTEHEKFAILVPQLRPLKYRSDDGTPGIRTLLDAMESCCGWRPQIDAGEVIALISRDGSIALEPGGQVEMSGNPHKTIHETRAELERHEQELADLSEELSVKWLWLGLQPVHGLDDIGWMPKRRYVVMRDYLPTRGSLARYMMQATCTVQANLDYGDEADMARKMRAAMGVGSIVTAMFANSPLKDGRPSGYKSFRAHVWHHTDPDRAGLLPFFFTGDGPSYEEYARWALDVPMFFVVRDNEYIPANGRTFRDFWEGRMGHGPATLEDWELHLSTLFPDVRMKTYIEMRTADVVQPELICALPALWKGLMYDDSALDATWDVVKRWSFGERVEHRAQVTKGALDVVAPGGHKTSALAGELLKIARWSLGRQAEAAGHADESIYLEPLESLVRRGWSPADEILTWYAEAKPTPRQIFERYLR